MVRLKPLLKNLSSRRAAAREATAPAAAAALPRARIRFSIVIPAYRTDKVLLNTLLQSILSQPHAGYEIIIVDDSGPDISVERSIPEATRNLPFVHIVKNAENMGIAQATNVGLDKVSGDYVIFIDHDDEITPNALELLAREIDEHPQTDVFYSDQITVDDQGETVLHFLKPEWSPIYFLGCMYVGHLLVVRTSICHALKIDARFDGVQDFEFMLRVSEHTRKIRHLDTVLYKWRAIEGSLAQDTGAKDHISELQTQAVQAHLDRAGRSWQAEPHQTLPHRVRLTPSRATQEPRISIVIPTKNQGEVVRRCLESLFALTHYENFEVVVVDNRTTDPIALETFRTKALKHVLYDEVDFNYSVANNMGVDASDGEYILFLNNDTEVVDCDWLRELVMFFEDEEIGAVGPTLLYPDRTVQHAGIVLGLRGTADHIMRGFDQHVDGYAGSLSVAREVSAVTAACLLMKRTDFDAVGRFSEDYARHYQDVDLCLKLRQAGKRIINAGGTRLIHHESLSRKVSGYDLGDRALLIDSWRAALEAGDPYYNRGFEISGPDYTPRPGLF